MSSWISHSKSIIGTSHLLRGEEKQDSVSVVHDKKGNISFCLSDGAGSSKYSGLSSDITSRFMAEALSKLPSMIEEKGTESWINDYIIQCVIDLRGALYKEFTTYDLRNYHCTLVSGVLFKDTCVVAHIGDGAILSGTSSLEDNYSIINEKLYLSEPKNGEYKNETYFITEPNWLKNLRIKVIPNVSWLIAGTDGGIDLLSLGDRLNDDLVFELLQDFIQCPPAGRDRQINHMMSSTKADEQTNDDKSLLIMISKQVAQHEHHVWQEDGNTFKDFYPTLKKNSSEPATQQKPNLIATTEANASPAAAIGKIPLVIRMYNFFHRQTILTVFLLLTSVVSAYILSNFLMSSSINEKNTDLILETKPSPSQPVINNEEDPPEEASLPKDNTTDDEANKELNVIETTQADTPRADKSKPVNISKDPLVISDSDTLEGSPIKQNIEEIIEEIIEAENDGGKIPVSDQHEVPNGISDTDQQVFE